MRARIPCNSTISRSISSIGHHSLRRRRRRRIPSLTHSTPLPNMAAKPTETLDLYAELATYENFVHAFSGMVGGVTAITAFYPLNNIRTRLQVDDSIKPGNMFYVSQQIVEKNGVYGLFQGWWSSVVSLGASNFTYFYTYNAFKTIYQVKVLGSRKIQIDPVSNLGLAALAGVVNVFLTTPLWVAGTRLSVQDGKPGGHGHGSSSSSGGGNAAPYAGVWDCLVRISREEGIWSLWKGVGPSLMLVSNPSIQFVTYERLRAPLTRLAERRGSPITSLEFFVIGAIAKAVATILTYPIQLAQSKMRNDRSATKPKNSLALLMQIYEKEGFVGLFKGMEAKLWQTVLTAAFQFLTYEKTFQFVANLLMPEKAAKGGKH